MHGQLEDGFGARRSRVRHDSSISGGRRGIRLASLGRKGSQLEPLSSHILWRGMCSLAQVLSTRKRNIFNTSIQLTLWGPLPKLKPADLASSPIGVLTFPERCQDSVFVNNCSLLFGPSSLNGGLQIIETIS